MQRNLDDFRTRGVRILAVSADQPEDSAKLIKEKGLTFDVACDPDLTVIDSYGVRNEGKEYSVPATFLLRANGSLRQSWVSETVTGRPTIQEVLEAIDALRSDSQGLEDQGDR